MAYNPYEAVKAIYDMKGYWTDADAAGDTTAKNYYAKDAEKYYKELAQNGYGDVADTLAKQTYEQAKSTYDTYAKYATASGQVPAPAASSPGAAPVFAAQPASSGSGSQPDPYAQYGDQNKQLWDSWGGQNNQLGQNGTDLYNRYGQWDDSNLGLYNQMAAQYGASNAQINDKNNKYQDTMYADKDDMGDRYSRLEEFNYSNPFTTEQGKSVLERYDLAALQGRDNEAAKGGADNGGNIDSYAAANALRQQASLRNLGEQSALAAHSRTVGDGRGILSDRGAYNQGIYDNLKDSISADIGQSNNQMANYLELLKTGGNIAQNTYGNYSDNISQWQNLLNTGTNMNQQLFDNNESREGRLFNEGETARLNDHNIKWDAYERESGITGNVPEDLISKNNPYFKDGALINKNVDYQGIIDQVDARLKTETDPAIRADLEATRRYANEARNYKMANYDGEYEQWLYSMKASAPEQNAAMKQYNSQLAYENKALDTNSADTRYGIDANAAMNADANATTRYGVDANVQMNADTNKTDLAKTLENNRATLEKARLDFDQNIKLQEMQGGVEKYLGQLAYDSQIRLANISAALGYYQTDSNAGVALAELAAEERQWQGQLAETARQYDASTGLSYAQLGEQGRQFDANTGLSQSQLAEAARQSDNANSLDWYKAALSGLASSDPEAASNAAYETVYKSLSGGGKDYLSTLNGKEISEYSLRQDIIDKSAKYGLTIEDARKICNGYGYETSWLADYEESYEGGLARKGGTFGSGIAPGVKK